MKFASILTSLAIAASVASLAPAAHAQTNPLATTPSNCPTNLTYSVTQDFPGAIAPLVQNIVPDQFGYFVISSIGQGQVNTQNNKFFTTTPEPSYTGWVYGGNGFPVSALPSAYFVKCTLTPASPGKAKDFHYQVSATALVASTPRVIIAPPLGGTLPALPEEVSTPNEDPAGTLTGQVAVPWIPTGPRGGTKALPKCYDLTKLPPVAGAVDHRGETCIGFRAFSPWYYTNMPAPGKTNYSLFMDLSLAGNNLIPRCDNPESVGSPSFILPALPPVTTNTSKSRCYRAYKIVIPANGFLNSHFTIGAPTQNWVQLGAAVDGDQLAK
jgi:hypothetical protein